MCNHHRVGSAVVVETTGGALRPFYILNCGLNANFKSVNGLGADMPRRTDNKSFSAKETKQRFEAALRGARIAGHKQKEDLISKRPSPRPKPVKSRRPSLMPTTYINFHAPVNPHTTQNLMTVIAQKLATGTDHFYIMLSTPGVTTITAV